MPSGSGYSSGIDSDYTFSPQSNCSSISRDDYDGKPTLRITKQPNKYHLFRYKTETRSTKTSATLELLNYAGDGVTIECYLVHYNVDKIHTHWLERGTQKRIIRQTMPKYASSVRINNLNVVQATSQDIKQFMKDNDDYDSIHTNKRNKHTVRIKFVAYDENDVPICDPVISQPIYNHKSVNTKGLKIIRISLTRGNPAGGDEVFCLVDKVAKNDILIRFLEHEEGSVIVDVKPLEVHHQYALVFRTPPYKNINLAQCQPVWIQLYRPSDSTTSKNVLFIYDPKAQPVNEDQDHESSSEDSSPAVPEDAIAREFAQMSIPQAIPHAAVESPTMQPEIFAAPAETSDVSSGDDLISIDACVHILNGIFNGDEYSPTLNEISKNLLDILPSSPFSEYNYNQGDYNMDENLFQDMVTDSGIAKVKTKKQEEIKSLNEPKTNNTVQNFANDDQNEKETNYENNIEDVQAEAHHESMKINDKEYDSGTDSPYEIFEDKNNVVDSFANNTEDHYLGLEASNYRDSAYDDESSEDLMNNNLYDNLALEEDVFEIVNLENKMIHGIESSVGKALDVNYDRSEVEMKTTADSVNSVEEIGLLLSRVDMRLDTENDLPDALKDTKDNKDDNEGSNGSEIDDIPTEIKNEEAECYLSTKFILLLQTICVLVFCFIIYKHCESYRAVGWDRASGVANVHVLLSDVYGV